MWITLGTGKNLRYLPAHWMANAQRPDRSVALPICYAFTGCDTVSCFGSRGKRTAWDIDEVTSAFCVLAASPETVDNWLGPMERCVVLLYDCTSSHEFVNRARKQLFTQKGRTIDGFLQHKQHYCTIQSGLLIKPVTVGHRQLAQLRSFHLQVNGGGAGMKTAAGKYAGQLFLKRHTLVENNGWLAFTWRRK